MYLVQAQDSIRDGFAAGDPVLGRLLDKESGPLKSRLLKRVKHDPGLNKQL